MFLLTDAIFLLSFLDSTASRWAKRAGIIAAGLGMGYGVLYFLPNVMDFLIEQHLHKLSDENGTKAAVYANSLVMISGNEILRERILALGGAPVILELASRRDSLECRLAGLSLLMRLAEFEFAHDILISGGAVEISLNGLDDGSPEMSVIALSTLLNLLQSERGREKAMQLKVISRIYPLIQTKDMGVVSLLGHIMAWIISASEHPKTLVTNAQELEDWTAVLLELAFQAVKQGKVSDSLTFSRCATRLHEKNAFARIQLAQQLRVIGDFGEAEKMLKEALKLEPSNLEGYLCLGLLYKEMKSFDLAVKTFQKGMSAGDSKNPLIFELCYNCASTLQEVGRPKEAVPLVKTLIAANPSYLSGYHMLGELLLQIGDSTQALAIYGEALRMAPSDAQTYMGMAQAWLAMGKIDETIRACRRARDFLPEAALLRNRAFLLEGEAWCLSGQWEEAEGALSQSIQLASQHGRPSLEAAAWAQRGILAQKRNQSAEAAEAFAHSLAIEKNEVALFHSTGNILSERTSDFTLEDKKMIGEWLLRYLKQRAVLNKESEKERESAMKRLVVSCKAACKNVKSTALPLKPEEVVFVDGCKLLLS